jgi:aryl-alcohol dehydrogenase-like predicted oxidoreductase
VKRRLLGKHTGLSVSALALGTGRLGMNRVGATDDNAAQRVLRAFAEAGGDLFDTSSAYQIGASEERLGAFLAEAGRDRFIIASKYGRTAQAAPASSLVGSHRKAMLAEVEGSLRRLRTDRIDIYMPHFDDGRTPIEEIMAGLDDLVRTGKIVHIALSNFPAWRIAEAAMLAECRGSAPLAAVQLEYSLLVRDADREHLPLAWSRGLGVMAYSPLGGGRLFRRLRNRSENDVLACALADIATEMEADCSAVALAWVRSKGMIPILGPRDEAQLAEGLAAGETILSAEQIERLNACSEPYRGQPYEVLAQTRARLAPADDGF